MAGFARTKRVTDPLDDKVKARIVGRDRSEPVYVSSGSEHGGENDDETPCLSDLVFGFLEDENSGSQSPVNESDSDSDPSMSDLIDDLINATVNENADSFKNALITHVSKAITVFSSLITDKFIFRRNVMAYLRNCGFNAAICKTKWESSGGLTAGNYEFIDVVRSDSAGRQHRYFIDLDFAGEFKIARATNQYERMVQALPSIFIGRSEELKQIAQAMSDAARRSLKSRGLTFPPWRKNRYMQNKWFGSYRRTTNVFPAKSPFLSTPANPTASVKCRSVGFDVVNSRLFVPAIARTR